jgi:hypothetical protein
MWVFPPTYLMTYLLILELQMQFHDEGFTFHPQIL